MSSEDESQAAQEIPDWWEGLSDEDSTLEQRSEHSELEDLRSTLKDYMDQSLRQEMQIRDLRAKLEEVQVRSRHALADCEASKELLDLKRKLCEQGRKELELFWRKKFWELKRRLRQAPPPQVRAEIPPQVQAAIPPQVQGEIPPQVRQDVARGTTNKRRRTPSAEPKWIGRPRIPPRAKVYTNLEKIRERLKGYDNKGRRIKGLNDKQGRLIKDLRL